MSLSARLIEEIKRSGPITVARYMELCAAHYYATRDPFGAQGDFTTAPEISQIFGELIGAWLADTWQRMGAPKALWCELGPGRGTLSKDALRATRSVPGFHDSLDIMLLETSPTLRQLQQQNLSHPRMSWRETLDDLPPLPLLLIANEFFDALPIQQFAGSEECKVTHEQNRFLRTPEKVSRETSPLSCTVMETLAAHIAQHSGAALIIDYGYTQGAGDSLQAMKAHQFVGPFATPGEADITAHVDFTALAHAAKKRGVFVHGPVEQGTFLKRLGAELRATALCRARSVKEQETILSGLERLIAPHQMGELFKVMAVTSSLDKPAGF